MRSRMLCLSWVVAAVVVLAVLGGCARGGAKPESGPVTEQATPVFVVKAEVGDIYQVEHLTGTVEPIREVDVQAELAGKVAWVGPEVGDHVGRGQALVRLDTAFASAGVRQSAAAERAARARYSQSQVGLRLTRDQTASQLVQAEKSMEAARNRLRQAKTAADLTRKRVEDTIKQAQIAVQQAQSQLADVRAGARSQEIAQAQARVDQARAAARLAKLSLDRQEALLKSGAVAQAQVDAAQVQHETAVGNQRVAEQALDLAKEGARTEQVRLAELQVAQAQNALTQAEAQRGQIELAERDVRAAEVALDQAEESVRLARAEQARITATEQDVKAAEAAVGQAEAASSYSRTQVAKHVIYAPISGVVAARNVDPGEGAVPGMSLLRIVNLNPVRVNAEASELQIDRMRVGQQAEVSIDALSGRQFVGTITDIAPQSQQGKRIYIVRVQVPNEQGVLRAGLFARVDIITALHQDAVLVPRDALMERGDTRVVYAVVNNKVQVRKVKLGAAEDSRVEVVKGVRGGDLLVYGGQSLLADGELVKPQLHDGKAALTGQETSP
jgi:RND family efflux transporter MFP subunit